MAIPILTYHAMRIHGNDVRDNDLVALSADLAAIGSRGWRVEPLADLVGRWLEDPLATVKEKVVAITCDDGSDFDCRDLPHPTWGMQRSVLNRLRDAAAGGGPRAHVTTFVIVSPEARPELDRSCMVGRGWWNDDWWAEAAASGYMHVASHSWDHNHDALPERFSHGVARGTFASIDRESVAEVEIAQAQAYLAGRAPNPGLTLFAYPYGDSSAFLRDEYLPRRARELGLAAALGGEPRPLTETSPRWDLPRYIHGRDWHTPAELEALLDDAQARG